MAFVSKKVVLAGHGPAPDFSDGMKALFHYRAEFCETGDGGGAESERRPAMVVIDDSRERWPRGCGKEVELIFGKKFKIPAWETCLRTMLVDEVAEFCLPAEQVTEFPFISKFLRDLARKESGGGDSGEGSSSRCMGCLSQAGFHYPFLDEIFRRPRQLVFTFHLLRVFRPEECQKDSWALDREEKLNSIAVLKTEGNQLYKQGQLSEAIQRYSVALDRIESLAMLETPGELSYETVSGQKVPLLLNLAQCFLTQNSYYEALKATEQVLNIDPANEKALFRRAKALAGTWHLAESREVFLKLLSSNAGLAPVISKEMEKIKKLQQEAKDASVKSFGKMFSK